MDTATTITEAHRIEDRAAELVGIAPRPASPWWRWSRDLRKHESRLTAEADALFWEAAYAHRYVARSMGARGERESSGYIGLYRAAVNFDPSLGHKFATYARWWVRVSLQKGRDNAPLMYVPNHAIVTVVAYERQVAALEAAGTPYDAAELLQETLDTYGVSHDRYRSALNAYQIERLDAPNEYGKLRDVPAPNGLASHALVEKRRHARAWHLIGSIEDERLQLVVKRRFGLDGQGGATLQAIGDELGLSKERVRQLEAIALDRMRDVVRHG